MADGDLRRVAEAKITRLYEVLMAARTTGIALGILMERHMLCEHDAFDALVRTSERSGRMVRELAADVIRTRELPRV